MIDNDIINICICGVLLEDEKNYLKIKWKESKENSLFISNGLIVNNIIETILSEVKPKSTRKVNIYFISNILDGNVEILLDKNMHTSIENLIQKLKKICVNKNNEYITINTTQFIFINHGNKHKTQNINTTIIENANKDKDIVKNNIHYILKKKI